MLNNGPHIFLLVFSNNDFVKKLQKHILHVAYIQKLI